jgi:hypothetical protein
MPHVDTIVGGSLIALARIAMFYGRRTEGSRRRQLFSTFLDEIGKTVKKMEMEPDELFDRLARRLADEVAVATVGSSETAGRRRHPVLRAVIVDRRHFC